MPRPLVVQTENLDQGAADWLRERADVVEQPFSDAAGLAAILPRADALVVRTYTKVNAELLNLAPSLKVVARAGVGLDNVDVPACRARNVEVVYTPDANSSAVVELVFTLLLDALRPRFFVTEPLPPARWAEVRKSAIAPRQLEDLTLGIIGLGRVGGRIARAAAGFGMDVLYHDLLHIDPARRYGADSAGLADLLAESDVVTLHVDGRAANRHLIGPRQLALLKPDATLINASRGMVVDHAALAAHLRSHPAASAFLDVHDPEPIAADNPLLGLPNAKLLPHLGAATAKAHTNMSWVVRDVWRVLSGEPAEFPAPATSSDDA